MNVTNCNSTLLTAEQIKIATELANPDFKGTISSLCKKVGISRSTLYRWLKNDNDFVKYVNELVETYTDSELAGVWKALIREAKSGNIQAIKLFFELKGKYTAKADIKIEGNINPFAGLTTEELKKMIGDG